MAAETTSTLYRTDEVMAFLDEDSDADLGDYFFTTSWVSRMRYLSQLKGIHSKKYSRSTSSKVLLIPTFPASDGDGDGEDSHEVPGSSSDQPDDDTVPEHVRCVCERVCVCVFDSFHKRCVRTVLSLVHNMSQRRRVKFCEWRTYRIYANFFDLSLERNATDRRNRIRVYSCDRLRCGERQRMRRDATRRLCDIL